LLMFSSRPPLTAVLVTALLLALSSTGSFASHEVVVPTPETDPVLARNLAAMSTQKSILDLEWLQPREVVAGTSDPVTPGVADTFPTPDALKKAREYSDAHKGLGLLVWHEGQLVDSHFSEGVSASTPFAAFSMHKSLLALALVAAVEDGIVASLDDMVGTYIPEWRDDTRGKITLRQLLQQVSGLAHFSMASGDPRAMALVLSSRISDTALSYPLAEPPGSEFNYNNVNSQIIGIALENALEKRGMRYAEYLSERLWRPLGNSDASLWIEHVGGSPRYFSGLAAGLIDWLHVGVMLLNEGRVRDRQLLSEESIALLSAPGALNAGYGLNIWLSGDWHPVRSYGPRTPAGVPHAQPFLASPVLFFDGFGGQRVYVVPSRSLVIARFGEVDMTYDDSIIVNALVQGLIDAESQAG
jgi:CubicO group peptidase (beta-lactamase class C family)